MNRSHSPKSSRREMLVGTARHTAVAALAALSAGLIAKRAVAPVGADCAAPRACEACRALARCDRPEARRARDNDGEA